MPSIEWPLVCGFWPNKIFLSTLFFSFGVWIEILCITHVRKNYYPTDSHTNYRFLEKVKIGGFGCYNHETVTNLANGDFWSDPFLGRSH